MTQAAGGRENPSAASPPTGPAAPRRRRGRRLGLLLGVLAAVLAVLVGLMPALLSTGPGTGLVEGVANGLVRGSVSVTDLSLSWGGPVAVGRLVVRDPQGREVVRAGPVTLEAGVWRLATAWEAFGRLSVQAPAVTLYLDEAGRPSLTEALEPREPSPPRPPGPPAPLPALVGQVIVTGGEVRIIRPGGREVLLADVTADVRLDTLDRVAATAGLRAPGGGRVTLEADLAGLVTEGRLEPLAGRGRAVLATGDGDVPLALLAEVAEADAPLTGVLAGTVKAVLADGRLKADVDLQARDVASVPAAGDADKPSPLGARFAGTVEVGSGQVAAGGRLTGDVGDLGLRVRGPLAAAPAISAEDALAAVFGGKALALPDALVEADGRLDLGRLGRAVPPLLRVLPGARITGGRLVISDLSVRGGERPAVRGGVELQDFAAETRGGPVVCRPMTLVLDAALDGDKGLLVTGATFTSGFGSASADGAPAGGAAAFDVTLDRLHDELGRILDLGDVPRRGALKGTADLAREGPDRATVALDAEVRDFEHAFGGRKVHVGAGRVEARGHVDLDKNRPTQVVIREGRAVLDGDLDARLAGTYRVRDATLDLAADVAKADLAGVGRRLRDLAVDGVPEATGTFQGRAEVRRTAPDAWAVVVVGGKLRGFSLREDLRTGKPAAPAATLDVDLAGRADLAAGRVRAEASLAGPAVNLKAALDFTRPEKPLRIDAADLLWTLLDGGRVDLPDFRADAAGTVDVAAVGRAVPGLLAASPEVAVTAGRVALERCEVRGGPAPAADVSLKVDGLAATVRGKPVQWASVTVVLKAAHEAGKGLRVAKGSVNAGFANLEVSGSPERYEAKGEAADLALLRERLGSLVDFGTTALAGGVRFDATASRPAPGRVDFAIGAAGRQVAWTDGKRKASADAVEVRSEGRLELADRRPARVTLMKATLAVPGDLEASARGWADLASAPRFEGAVEVRGADVAALVSRAAAAGADVKRLAEAAGTLDLAADVKRAAADQPVLSSGWATVADLRRKDAKAGGAAAGTIRAEWTGAAWHAEARRVAAESVRVIGPDATLRGEAVALVYGETLRPNGRLTVEADLGPTLALVQPLAGWEKPPAVLGRLTWVGTASPDGERIRVRGKGKVADLRVGAGKAPFAQKEVAFTQDAVLDAAGDEVMLDGLTVQSEAVTATLAGRVAALGGECVLDLAGTWEGSWDEITRLLHGLAPATAETVLVSGRTEGRIEVKGPARKPDARPAYRGLSGGTALAWSQAKVYGVTLQAGPLPVRLEDGQVVVPDTPVATADGGQVLLGATLDLRDGRTVLRLPGRRRVADNLTVTRQMATDLLARINPILGWAMGGQGQVTLHTEDIVLPLAEETPKGQAPLPGPRKLTGGSGRGRLDLDKLQLRSEGFLWELLRLGGMAAGEDVPMQFRGVDFEVRDGRIWYDNFAAVFPRNFELVFLGSVGFDDSLDLKVAVPLTAALLERLGARGPVADYVRILTGARVVIPLTGTRHRPKLEFEKVDVRPLVERAVRALLAEQAGKAIGDLLKPPPKQPPPPAPGAEPGPAEPKPGPRRPGLIGDLLDLFGPAPKQPEDK